MHKTTVLKMHIVQDSSYNVTNLISYEGHKMGKNSLFLGLLRAQSYVQLILACNTYSRLIGLLLCTRMTRYNKAKYRQWRKNWTWIQDQMRYTLLYDFMCMLPYTALVGLNLHFYVDIYDIWLPVKQDNWKPKPWSMINKKRWNALPSCCQRPKWIWTFHANLYI